MILSKLFTKNKTTVGLNSVYHRTSGFTIVEILVVITVSALLASPVIFSLGGFYDDNLTSVTLSAQDTEVKNATTLISNDLKEATGFRASLTIPTATPQPPLGSSSNATTGGNWSYCGTTTTSTTCDGVTTNSNYSSNRVLIAYVDATDGPTTSTTYNPVFLNSGAFNLSTATRATNAYIYFVAPDRTNSSINNLYRRTIVNVDPTNDTDLYGNALYDCSVPIGQNPSTPTNCTSTTSIDTKNSCASTVVSTNASFCSSRDAVILRNVESFWIDYYYSSNQKISDVYTNNATTTATVVSNIKNSAQSAQVTITKKLSGSPAKRSIASTRITNASQITNNSTSSTPVSGVSYERYNPGAVIDNNSSLIMTWSHFASPNSYALVVLGNYTGYTGPPAGSVVYRSASGTDYTMSLIADSVNVNNGGRVHIYGLNNIPGDGTITITTTSYSQILYGIAASFSFLNVGSAGSVTTTNGTGTLSLAKTINSGQIGVAAFAQYPSVASYTGGTNIWLGSIRSAARGGIVVNYNNATTTFSSTSSSTYTDGGASVILSP